MQDAGREHGCLGRQEPTGNLKHMHPLHDIEALAAVWLAVVVSVWATIWAV